MEHTHPNVTLQKEEKLSGGENESDKPPADDTATTNTSQPAISQAELEALMKSIGAAIMEPLLACFLEQQSGQHVF